MTKDANIRDYAAAHMNRLLTALAFQVHRTVQKPGVEEIHDLRVGIRRLSQALRLFRDFVPGREAAKIERRLKHMMRLTSQIRNRDIALEFLARSQHGEQRRRLEKQRKTYQREFSDLVRRWTANNFSARWRDGLSLRGV